MFEDIEVVGIARVGHDYALVFSDGSYAIFCAEDLESMLGCDASCLLLNNSSFYLH